MLQIRKFFTGAVVLALCAGPAWGETVHIKLDGEANLRSSRTKRGRTLLVPEDSLPAGAEIEVDVDEIKDARKLPFWDDDHRKAPVYFVRGIRIVRAPGFSEKEIRFYNEIHRHLYIARSVIESSKVLKGDGAQEQVRIPGKTDFYHDEPAPLLQFHEKKPAPEQKHDDARDDAKAVNDFEQLRKQLFGMGNSTYCDQAHQDLFNAFVNQGVPSRALAKALAYYEGHPDRIRNRRYIAINDLTAHSSTRRMFVLDLQEKTVARHFVAHGRGSDTNHDGYAESFSDRNKSHATPAGFLVTAETYSGHHGYSLRLDGLEARNRSTRARDIVVHGAEYATAAYVKANGRTGRSWGCAAIDYHEARDVINQLKNGALFYNYDGS